MVTPDNLYQILMALKDAGVVRAKFGDVEIDFAPAVDYQPAPQVVAAPKTAPQIQMPQAVEPKQASYHDLFGKNVPRFTPVES